VCRWTLALQECVCVCVCVLAGCVWILPAQSDHYWFCVGVGQVERGLGQHEVPDSISVIIGLLNGEANIYAICVLVCIYSKDKKYKKYTDCRVRDKKAKISIVISIVILS